VLGGTYDESHLSAEASHLALNPVFQLKAILVAAGLINVAIYEFWAKRSVEHLAPGASTPSRAKVAGLLSLAIWSQLPHVGVALRTSSDLANRESGREQV
jgi:hypothetical protein